MEAHGPNTPSGPRALVRVCLPRAADCSAFPLPAGLETLGQNADPPCTPAQLKVESTTRS